MCFRVTFKVVVIYVRHLERISICAIQLHFLLIDYHHKPQFLPCNEVIHFNYILRNEIIHFNYILRNEIIHFNYILRNEIIHFNYILRNEIIRFNYVPLNYAKLYTVHVKCRGRNACLSWLMHNNLLVSI